MPRWHLKFFSLLAVVLYCSASNFTNHHRNDTFNNNSTCNLPDCRRCDILNVENCTCTKLYLSCATGFKLSEDGCSCVEARSTSIHCPDLVCPKNLYINEAECECTNKTCPNSTSCERNQILDLKSCNCTCGIDSSSCPKNSTFDEKNCVCINSACETSMSCPKNTIWDSQLCQCRCRQNKRCAENFIFDGKTCDCEPNFPTKSIGLRYDTSDSYTSDSGYQSDTTYSDTYVTDTIYSSSCLEREQCLSQCDYFDEYNCQCWKVYYDCFPPWQFSEKGCTCYLITESPNCPGVQCQGNEFLDERLCRCIDKNCAYYSPWEYYYYNECVYSSSSSYPECPSIPDCRWCDYMDYDRCECIRNEITCDEGYELSEDGCFCSSASSTPSNTTCQIPDCRWCDHLDTENCECIRVAVDCAPGYELSNDGCSCTEISSPNCTWIPGCRQCDTMDYEKCKCIRSEDITCEEGYELSEDGCFCYSTATPSSTKCEIPDCRWCDYLDTVNCECLKADIYCSDVGFELSADGCSCVETNSSSSSIVPSCSIPDCRRCDILDLDNCTCTKVYLACAVGFVPSEDGCSCVQSNFTSIYCPDLFCPPELNLNEARCECTDKICETFAPCPLNHVLDLETCECKCTLNSDSCPFLIKFDEKNCRCEGLICDYIQECPDNMIWDFDLCKCKCTQYKLCADNFVFDAETCDCILADTSLTSYFSPDSSSSSCILPSCRSCDQINYFDCTCNTLFVDCFWPSRLSQDGCSCEIITTSANCPGVTCNGYTFIDEQYCTCIDLKCAENQVTFLPPCYGGFTRDPHDCGCVCNKTAKDCPKFSTFDEESCECIAPLCDSPIECLKPFILDPVSCTCKCRQSNRCRPGYEFSQKTCKCELKRSSPPSSSTAVESSSDSPSCSIPDCRWCDFLDLEACECHKVAIKCAKGFITSEDGCSCIPISSPSSSTAIESSIESSSPSCSIPDCRWCDFLDLESCECHRVAIKCARGFITSEDGCSCIPISSPSNSTAIESSTEPSLCSIPDCRWCDYLDTENCECYRVAIDCIIGYTLSSDGCSCVEDPNYSPPSTEEPMSSIYCDLSDCRWCDYRDYDNCECFTRYLDCEWPQYILSNDGCSCVENPDRNSTQIASDSSSSSQSPSSTSETSPTSSSTCDLSDCRWCDFADYNDCICYKKSVQCEYPEYILSNDGCTCSENPNWHSNSPSSDSSSSSQSPSSTSENSPSSSSKCDLTGCRWCDFADYNTCICYKKSIKCEYPQYILSNDGCTCSENPNWHSNSLSSDTYSDSISSESPSFSDTSSSSSNNFPSSSRQCDISNCRRCDYLDPNTCTCYRRLVQCPEPEYILSKDACTCEPNPVYPHSIQSSSSIIITNEPPSSSTNITTTTVSTTTSKVCDLSGCRWCDFADYKSCFCFAKSLQCEYPRYIPNGDGCLCVENPDWYSTPPSLSSSSQETTLEPPIECSLPECNRWCDHIDYINCVCHPRIVDCYWPYQLSDDGCSCEEIPNLSYSSSSDIQSSSTSSCSITDCRWCDNLDLENCECHRIAIDCLPGYDVSEDGCTCVKVSDCPGFICPSGMQINYDKCKCEKINCDSPPYCPPSFILDKKMCECRCDLTPDSCPPFYHFDEANCICRHPPCDPPGPCPGNTDWNSETCRCECRIKKKCRADYIFNPVSCNCELPYSSTYTSSSVEQPSSIVSSGVSQSPCMPSHPQCKWCDVVDYENCQCIETVVDCLQGFELSSDHCSCIQSNITSEKCPGLSCDSKSYIDEEKCICVKRVCETFAPCPVNQIMDEETCECHCDITADSCPPYYFFDESSCICRHPPCDPPGPCPGLMDWNWESCRCECFMNSGCPEDSIFDFASCSCIPNYSSSFTDVPSITQSSSPCFIPSCRWCDVMDIENCLCHKTYINCSSGYEVSSDGCSCNKNCNGVKCPDFTTMNENTCECIPSSPSNRTSFDYSDSSTDVVSYNYSYSSCNLPTCHNCLDYIDTENCVCHQVILDCEHSHIPGLVTTEDGCSCVWSNRTSNNCPGVSCAEGFFINETKCVCISNACKDAPLCPDNFLMDPQTCECFCGEDPSRCENYFDYDSCKCRHPVCDPPFPCPDGQSWNPEECKCRCIQTRLCVQNFTFDQNSCDCVCDPSLLHTNCPYGTVFDPQYCECVEEVECMDYNDPLCGCECEEVLECPGKKEFDLDFCECMCPFTAEQCDDGFIMSDETCECVKN